jgi:hypothetical protein
MRIDISVESSRLEKPEELIVDKVILNNVYFLYVIYDSPTCLNYKVPYKNISTNSHTNTNETIRTE